MRGPVALAVALALIGLREWIFSRRHREVLELLRRIAEKNGAPKNGPGSAAPPSAAGSGPG